MHGSSSRGHPVAMVADTARRRCLALLAACAMALPAGAGAADLSLLKSFLSQTTGARARFSQIVMDRNYRKLQTATGTMEFQRPGKFRWAYEKPHEQLIVGDGTKLWIWDKDLNQVTVKGIAQAIGSTPAALLAGSNDIEKSFTLSSIGNQEGLDWLEAVPRASDSTFKGVRLGFAKGSLEAMELHDNFGQITVIRFADIERNPKFGADVFRFTPPKGADVISD